MILPPPRPTLFPYTTLFRSSPSRSVLYSETSMLDEIAQAVLAREEVVKYLRGSFGEQGDQTRERIFGYLEELRTTQRRDRKSTRLNSSHMSISYAVFCLKKK